MTNYTVRIGNDILQGGAGDDRLYGDSGADNMEGGTGDDRYYIDNPSDTVMELVDEGYDRVYSTIDYILGDNLEQLGLKGHADLTGTGNSDDNRLYGNSGANHLLGAEGNDRLYGKAGNDTLQGNTGDDRLDGGSGVYHMEGGTGDDRYTVDDLADTVLELAGEGNDRVYSTVNFSLNENLERLYLTGEADIFGTGNSEDNKLYGNKGANVLTGGEGNDSLYGRNGNDTLQGGAGNDRLSGDSGADVMVGGSGDDRYTVDNFGDSVTESADEGNDRVYSSIDYRLGQHLERLYLSGGADLTGVGNNQDNRIYGNRGDNSLSGEAGDDRLYGGEGDDTYIFARNDNQDTLIEKDATLDNHDVLSFLHDINHDQLWFSQDNDDLRINIIGTSDQVTIEDGYDGQAQQLEEIQASDGFSLANNQVDQLVSAMASFNIPDAGELTLSSDLQEQLAPILVASWT